MKLKSLTLLMALVLFAAACGSQQGSEQTVAEDRAAAGGEEEKSQELRRISRLDDPTERIQKLEAFIQANSGDPIVSRAQSSLLRALAEEEPKRALELADQMLQDPEAGNIVQHELRSLIKKLPTELSGADHALPVQDEQWIADVIESASSEVLARLRVDDHISASDPEVAAS